MNACIIWRDFGE